MSRTIVAVLRGGPSSEYDVSLNTGAQILKHLPEHYDRRDVFISKDGQWHVGGIMMDPHRSLRGVDVVFNAMHGEYGEDGKVQQILDAIGVPYTGSGAVSSARAMNKHLTKKVYHDAGLRTPRHVLIHAGAHPEETADLIFKEFHFPLVVKAVALGSSMGVVIVKQYNDLARALIDVSKISPKIMVEEYIAGREGTCGVLEDFRNDTHYTPFPVEIIHPHDRDFFDYESKYNGKTIELCPSTFSETIKQEMADMARRAHKALGLRHYSRSDFRIAKNGKIYILETNTLPGMTAESLFPKSMAAVGCSFPEFLHHVVQLALHKKV